MKISFCAPVDIHWLARAYGAALDGVACGLGSTATTPLVIELLRGGHEVTIYTLSYELRVEQQYTWGALRLFVGPGRQFGAARDFFRPETAYLRQVIRADNPVFVHAHWTYEFALGALASGVPTLVTIHDLPWNVLRYFRDRYRTVRLLMAYAVAFRATRYTAVSEDAARHFTRYMRPGAQIAIIPNFVPSVVQALMRGCREHPQRSLVFATTLQGWTRRKNPKPVLRSFVILRERFPGAKLIMIGSDYQEGGAAQAWAKREKLSTGVTFMGPMEYRKMLEYLQSKIDCIIVPSLDESFSMAALEGMALGLPVVAGSRTPGIREVLGYGECGYLTNVSRPRDIAKAMTELQENAPLYEHISRVAFDRAKTVYSAERVVRGYERMYATMIAEAGKQRKQRSKDTVLC